MSGSEKIFRRNLALENLLFYREFPTAKSVRSLECCHASVWLWDIQPSVQLTNGRLKPTRCEETCNFSVSQNKWHELAHRYCQSVSPMTNVLHPRRELSSRVQSIAAFLTNQGVYRTTRDIYGCSVTGPAWTDTVDGADTSRQATTIRRETV